MTDALIPDGWSVEMLDDLNDAAAPICYGVLKPGPNQADGVVMLRVKDVREGVVQVDDVYRITSKLDRDFARSRLCDGDVIISVQGSVGRVAVVPQALTHANISRTLARIRPLHEQLTRWIWLALQAPQMQERMGAVVAGTTRDSLNIRDLRALEVPLPPAAEQGRIISKVEALLARVNASRERLARVPAILRLFRQSVLAAACSGRLTEDWREQHQGLRSATNRVSDLVRDREALWRARQAARNGERRVKYKPPFPATDAALADLPETWTWVTVSNLALMDVGFAFKSTEFEDHGIRLLRGENVEPGRLRWNDVRCWPKSRIKDLQHLLIDPGEIILALDRPLVSAGLKIARATPDDVPCLLVQRVMRFKMVNPSDTDFLYLCLREKRFIDFLAREGMTGSDLPHITGTGVAEFPVPLPPQEEQQEIVRRVDTLMDLADTVEGRLGAATARADKLTQSILAKALRGELVPTEADLARQEGRKYELTSELLERIRADRAATPSGASQKSPRRHGRTRSGGTL